VSIGVGLLYLPWVPGGRATTTAGFGQLRSNKPSLKTSTKSVFVKKSSQKFGMKPVHIKTPNPLSQFLVIALCSGCVQGLKPHGLQGRALRILKFVLGWAFFKNY
jgi:hypothetical protein